MNQRQLSSDIVGLAKVMPPLSRRGFMSSSAAAAAGYTLAAGPVRADVIHTDTKGLEAGDAKVAVTGGEMPVYYARPAGGQRPPIVLVCMEIFGVHEFIKDVTRRLGHLGAFAVAPDYYFRLGDMTKVSDAQELMPKVNSKNDAELFADLDATVAWAKSQGGDNNWLGTMGFCRGGRNVWHYSAHNPNLKAGVAFYGMLADKSDAAPIDRPCAEGEGAGARALRRSRHRHLGRSGSSDGGRAQGQRQDRRIPHLSWRAARLRRRLPRELSQGGGGRRVEQDGRLVQKVQSLELIG
jgi:Dienelactone hydrolase family